ncbi:MAG: hypothetical protein NTV98_05335, partial [Candidatus Roizmanbacteria bacterium]|nr:hypothetical protein [Candidatus Roizmanbacteria bacterium]
WRVILVYSLPFFLYILYLAFSKNKTFLKHTEVIKKEISPFLNPYMIFIFLSIGVDIFIVRKYLELVIFVLSCLWIIGISAYQLKSHHSFKCALTFLILCPIFIFANMDWVAEKCAIWVYLFLTMGTIHAIIEIKSGESQRLRNFFAAISNFKKYTKISSKSVHDTTKF